MYKTKSMVKERKSDEETRLANVVYKMFLFFIVMDQEVLNEIIRDVWMQYRWKSVTIFTDKINKNKPFDISEEFINEDVELIFDFLIQMLTLTPKFDIISMKVSLFQNEAFFIPITYLKDAALNIFLFTKDNKHQIFKKVIASQEFQAVYTNSNITVKKINLKARCRICTQAHIIFFIYCLSKIRGENKKTKYEEEFEIQKNIKAYFIAISNGYNKIVNGTQSLGIYNNEKQQILKYLKMIMDKLHEFF